MSIGINRYEDEYDFRRRSDAEEGMNFHYYSEGWNDAIEHVIALLGKDKKKVFSFGDLKLLLKKQKR